MSSLSVSLPLPVLYDGGQNPYVVSTNTNTEIKSTDNFTIESKEIQAFSNYILLNANDVGPGITKSPAIGGIGIARGSQPTYQLVWNEGGHLLTGLGSLATLGALNVVPTVAPTTTSQILAWDQTTATFVTPPLTTNLSINNLTLAGTTNFNGQTLTWPPNQGANGYILRNNGFGQLSWVANTTGAASGVETLIVSTDGKTSVDTQRLGYPDTVMVKTNNVDTMAITTPTTRVNNRLVIGGGLSMPVNTVISSTYSVSNTETIIKYTGSSNGTITLPSSSNIEGRFLIIYNLTSFTLSVASPSLIDGGGTVILQNLYDHIKVIADGVNNWIVI